MPQGALLAHALQTRANPRRRNKRLPSRGAPMPIHDNPFDPDRELARCACGRHRSEAEHEHEARFALKCAPVAAPSEEKRYEGVVANAVMRQIFPQDAARRAFLKGVGTSTA